MKKVLLAGPLIGEEQGSYGGGVGGYTRNMALYLNEFQNENYKLIPFFHTVRKKGEIKLISFPVRFIKDLFSFIWILLFDRPEAVHILGQYRNALPREAAWCATCGLLRIPYIYEIKAGEFIDENRNKRWHRWLCGWIIRSASLILCEGREYIDYLRDEFSVRSFLLPNVVSEDEIPAPRTQWFTGRAKILFVGYCYEGKGIYELVGGVSQAAADFELELNLVGAESPDFTTWLDGFDIHENLQLVRHGKLEHSEVLQIMKECDIYGYPTRHQGEGHNNSINEAMMNELVVLTTKAGFLEDVVGECGFFLDEVTKEEITRKIGYILNHKELAIEKARDARKKIEKRYNATVQKRRLFKLYKDHIFID